MRISLNKFNLFLFIQNAVLSIDKRTVDKYIWKYVDYNKRKCLGRVWADGDEVRKAQSCSGCIFTQVFTIHGVKYNKVLSTFYALLPEKSQQTYSRVIEQIQILKLRLSQSVCWLTLKISKLTYLMTVFRKSETVCALFTSASVYGEKFKALLILNQNTKITMIQLSSYIWGNWPSLFLSLSLMSWSVFKDILQ